MFINECFVARSPTALLVDMVEVLTQAPDGFVLHPSHCCQVDEKTQDFELTGFSLAEDKFITINQ